MELIRWTRSISKRNSSLESLRYLFMFLISAFKISSHLDLASWLCQRTENPDLCSYTTDKLTVQQTSSNEDGWLTSRSSKHSKAMTY
jgi:hypothetical protein